MGQKLSTVYCIYCETKTQHEEEMIDLSVPLPAGSNVDANFIQVNYILLNTNFDRTVHKERYYIH